MKQKENNKRTVGIFFMINNKKYVTQIDYRSKNNFIKLLENFAKNAKVYQPRDFEEFKFIPLEILLNNAYWNLENKQRASKLVINLMAQNSCNFHQ